MVRAHVERLLPHPTIGTAPPGGTSLVNIETVMWAATPSDIELGRIRLLGHDVDLRAHLERAAWRFGDGTTETADGPGTPYSTRQPCRTKTCPGYFGHVYRHTGRVAIEAELTWTGRFRVDGGAWQDIPGTVDAPATGSVVRVREARAILVPNE
jgi:hypothetical protein